MRKSSYASADVAIIGMACSFPKAADMRAYWANILNKVKAIGEPLPEWGAERHFNTDDVDAGRISTTQGGFLGDLYRFNSLEFGIMPNSVDGGEPDHFLALKIARDALIDAGYLADYDHTNTGCILGHSTYLHRGNANVVQHGVVVDQTVELLQGLFPEADAKAFDRLRELLVSKLPSFNADVAPGLVPNVMTGRIANRLDLRGPNYIIDAACASSLLAVGASIEELRRGDSDLMLAGGVNASMPAEVLAVFTQLGALSETATVSPFGESANGTLLGEGLGVVVLKRLEDAHRDGDRVYAVLKGVGHSSDGKALGLLAPNLEGEVLAMQRTYEQTGIDPKGIGLIEAHGTGIPLGDKTEVQALTRIFGERDGELPRCAIGSVKSMISHCIPAAGAAGLIKTALALYHRVLPPTLCERTRDELGLEGTPFYVNTELKPWIHADGKPRRAAVNAFGFGGINTHAILEEAVEQEARETCFSQWPSEAVVLAGDDRAALIGQVDACIAMLEAVPDAPLRDVSYTSIKQLADGPQRLAIVARDVAELSKKLGKARERLLDESRDQFQTRSGMFFSAAPLPGQLAFLFPGEGAQYHGMLGELAMHFPLVRQWFDFWESIFSSSRELPSTSAVFPPPNSLTEESRKRLEQQLYSLRIGSESMFIANQALFHLLRLFGVEPDAMLGHSSGENSALVAGGLARVNSKDKLREHILRLNRMYEQMESEGAVARGALLTIGAIPRDEIIAMVSESAGELHLALDNCHHQTVLFGTQEAMDVAAKTLRKRGGLCVFLPFDRAYHTPLFKPVADTVERFLQDMDFGPAAVPVYSCVDAKPFPSDPAEIRHKAAVQWSSTVRFIDTVERMYDDGVRYFIEVGPSGNLTAFVDDILRDRQHVAVSTNNKSKSDMAILLQVLGRLFVNGRNIAWDRLFEGRDAALVDPSNPGEKKMPAVAIANTLPYVRLEPGEIAELRDALGVGASALPAQLRAQAPAVAQAAAVPPPAAPATAAATQDPTQPAAQAAPERLEHTMHTLLDQAGDMLEAPAPPADELDDDRTTVVREYLHLMQGFLEQQQRVLGQQGVEALASTSAAAASYPANEAQPGPVMAPSHPFLQRLIEHSDTHAVAEFDLHVATQRFLRHHVLYARAVSDVDPELTSLPVSPLSVSMEMMAQIAAVLGNGAHLVALENLRAYNWVAVDTGERTIRLKANATNEPGRIHAVVCAVDNTKLVEADVLFAAQPLADTGPLLDTLGDPQAPLWSDDQLYTTGMFHGPLFHSVRSLLAWDHSGMDLALEDTPTAGFFEDEPASGFYANPVLMDSVGHLTAFWLAQSIGTDFSSFPSSIERIELIDPSREATRGCVLRGRLGFVDGDASNARFLEGDFDCVDASTGQAVFRIRGWRDVFFRVPHTFYYARSNPREGWYGEDWTGLFEDAPQDVVLWHLPAFPEGFLDDAGAVWKRLIAYTVLSAKERQQWHELGHNPQRLSEWLLGRLAIKEAVRYWLAQTHGELLCPADIEVTNLESGQPALTGTGLEAFAPLPDISLAHVGGMCMAAAAASGSGVGVDLETLGRVNLDDFLAGALTEAERAQVAAMPSAAAEEHALRLWCAKEAAAKLLGTGFDGAPHNFRVSAVDGQASQAVIDSPGGQVPVRIARHEEKIIALARVD